MSMSMSQPLIEVKGLKTYYPIYGGLLQRKIGDVKAVDGVNFAIRKGETFGLVGESGCGKSTTGRSILRLIEPTDGEVWYQGKNLVRESSESMRRFRKDLQIIFQDPYASLNPRMTVGQIIEEPLIVHRFGDRSARKERVQKLLEVVGLSAYHANRYAHEFSGGQRQRIGIARALALNPKFIIADEPVSALDVSIQSQILNLIKDLQEEFDLTYLFISHDLSVIRHICNRVAVMYLGQIVEVSDKDSLYDEPLHPYTQALLSAVPVPDPRTNRSRIILQGDVPSPASPPKGCPFHPRCPKAFDACKHTPPRLASVGADRQVACHLYTESVVASN